jgi:hypothetical protein
LPIDLDQINSKWLRSPKIHRRFPLYLEYDQMTLES